MTSISYIVAQFLHLAVKQLRRFANKVKSEGMSEALYATYRYIEHLFICYIYMGFHLPNLINTIRFRDHRIFFSCDIPIILPKSTRMGHPVGIVINRNTEIGGNVSIGQNVTIGYRSGDNSGHPTIKDNVTIHSGAVILGDVVLERGCTVGANAVVLEDVGEGKTVVGLPAKEV